MIKKIFMILITGMFISGVGSLSLAMQCGEQDSGQQIAQSDPGQKLAAVDVATQVTSKEAVNAGNKICPVSGEKIDEKFKATYEYKGKIYNFCCAMCFDAFKKDPEKYIKKVEEELQNKAGEEIKEEGKSMPESMHEGH